MFTKDVLHQLIMLDLRYAQLMRKYLSSPVNMLDPNVLLAMESVNLEEKALSEKIMHYRTQLRNNIFVVPNDAQETIAFFEHMVSEDEQFLAAFQLEQIVNELAVMTLLSTLAAVAPDLLSAVDGVIIIIEE